MAPEGSAKIIVGTKCDKEWARQVQYDQGKAVRLSHILKSKSLDIFKRNLKTHLFKKRFT